MNVTDNTVENLSDSVLSLYNQYILQSLVWHKSNNNCLNCLTLHYDSNIFFRHHVYINIAARLKCLVFNFEYYWWHTVTQNVTVQNVNYLNIIS